MASFDVFTPLPDGTIAQQSGIPVIHSSITEARIVKAVKRYDGTGFCTACGRKAKGFVEPDAEHYSCLFITCGKPAVYGAEQLLLMTVALGESQNGSLSISCNRRNNKV